MGQKEININNQSFYNAIAGIDPVLLHEKSIQQIILDGLEAYKKIQGCISAALYTINQQTFEFQYEISTEGVDKADVENSYRLLAENGSIANALSTGEITYGQIKNETHTDDFLIIPLIVLSGITGLIILSLNESFTGQENTIEICRIYSNYYAFLMQNQYLTNEIENIKILSEQNINSRTDKIVKSTRELKTILDTVQAGIIIVDKKTLQIADANLAAIELAGVLKEEIIGTSSDALFTSQDGSAKSTKIDTNLEELLKRKDGTLIPVIKTNAGINLGDEEFIIETFLDITDQKKMEEALRDARDRLEQRVEERTFQLSMANKELQKEINERIKIGQELLAAKEKAEQSDKLKSNILANMQHEFRTPLIGIQGFSKILMEEIKDADLCELSKYIFSSGQRLLNTLNSILYMSKFESDSVSVQLKKQNISQKINDIISPFEMTAAEKNIELKLFPGENIYVMIDIDLFSQAIINLLDNAFKFTKKGSVTVIIDKVEEDRKGWAVIKITDTGIGIKESELAIIFNPFRQASEGFARDYEGNGLGLTLSKRMIEMMDGKITLESKYDFGSTFTVWLPIQRKF
ncbi:MAG: PAS domain-containing sensor histidine kinase [Ignavibacteriaceae bacterium]